MNVFIIKSCATENLAILKKRIKKNYGSKWTPIHLSVNVLICNVLFIDNCYYFSLFHFIFILKISLAHPEKHVFHDVLILFFVSFVCIRLPGRLSFVVFISSYFEYQFRITTYYNGCFYYVAHVHIDVCFSYIYQSAIYSVMFVIVIINDLCPYNGHHLLQRLI